MTNQLTVRYDMDHFRHFGSLSYVGKFDCYWCTFSVRKWMNNWARFHMYVLLFCIVLYCHVFMLCLHVTFLRRGHFQRLRHFQKTIVQVINMCKTKSMYLRKKLVWNQSEKASHVPQTCDGIAMVSWNLRSGHFRKNHGKEGMELVHFKDSATGTIYKETGFYKYLISN